jgi:Fic family protein
MLYQTPKLEEKDLKIIEQIGELKKKLRYNTASAPKRWFGLLRRSVLAKNIRMSNSIEGYVVSKDDAIAVVEGVEPIDSTGQDIKENLCYHRAMSYVLNKADDPTFSYSIELLKSLHFMMLEYDNQKSPGQFRSGSINIYDTEKKAHVYEGPDADALPELLSELVEFLNSSISNVSQVVLGAMGHLNLVNIHPFRDGNGRMSRCLQTLILAQDRSALDPIFVSIESYLGVPEHTRKYYDVLQKVGGSKWSPERSTLPWVRFCLEAHYIQANVLMRLINNMGKLYERLVIQVKDAGLPERTNTALMDAARNIKVRNATYRPQADNVSEQVASRDLKELVERGFLIPKGSARGRFYEASEKIMKIKDEVWDRKRIESPYSI